MHKSSKNNLCKFEITAVSQFKMSQETAFRKTSKCRNLFLKNSKIYYNLQFGFKQ